MDSNKVYKDIVYLLYNILDNEKLRYELYKDDKYRDLYISLVDDLLTLEKDESTTFNDEQWATTYGKAIVVISQAKQRFERLTKSVEKIYEDYSKMIAFSMNSYEISRDELTKDKLKFSKDDVLYNGRLSDDTIKKYDDLAKEAKAKKAQEQEETIFLNNGEKVKPGDNQTNNQSGQGFNPFGQGPNGQSYEDAMNNMPENPLQDPRFYPYTKKPKWMPALKITLGVIVILTAVLLIIASAFAMSKSVVISDITDKIPLGRVQIADGDSTKTIAQIIKDSVDKKTIPGTLGIDANAKDMWSHIISYIFYCIPAAYLGWACFKKPASTSEKYRISYWPVVFMILFFGLSIGDSYQFASVNEIKLEWKQFFGTIKGLDTNKEAFTGAFDSWFNGVSSSQQLHAVAGLVDAAIAFLCLSVVFGIILCILNPKTDKMKIEKAMNEYQRAAISAMQGIPYTMDQSIYEPDDDVIIKNKSKFAIWWENLFKKNKSKKNKKNDKKDK